MPDKVVVTKSKLDSLANAIAEASGESLPMTLTQMESAVEGMTRTQEQWELISDITVNQNSTEISVSVDTNGLSFTLKKLVAIFQAGQSTTGTKDAFYGQVYTMQNGSSTSTSFPSLTYPTATSTMFARIEVEAAENMPIHCVSITGTSEGNSQNVQGMPKGTIFFKNITGIRIYQSGSTKSLIPSGANLKLYGIRCDD